MVMIGAMQALERGGNQWFYPMMLLMNLSNGQDGIVNSMCAVVTRYDLGDTKQLCLWIEDLLHKRKTVLGTGKLCKK